MAGREISVSLLNIMATPRITFLKSPISGAEKDLCVICKLIWSLRKKTGVEELAMLKVT